MYGYYSSICIAGTSGNHKWKVSYKKITDTSEGTGWIGSIKQLDDQKITVKEILFLDNNKVLAKSDSFEEGKDIDGSVTTVHPFSTEFYWGYAPEKGHTYKIAVTWEGGNRILFK